MPRLPEGVPGVFNRLWGAMTPFSKIALYPTNHDDHYQTLETMDVPMEEAVLVIRGKVERNGTVEEAEIQVGNLATTGDRNGIVLIHTAETAELTGYGALTQRFRFGDEYRLLVDCALEPDKNGHAYTIRLRDVNS